MTYSHPCPGCEQREQRIAVLEEYGDEANNERAELKCEVLQLRKTISSEAKRIAELEAEKEEKEELEKQLCPECHGEGEVLMQSEPYGNL
jgi:Zn finger protein HypA/HybF involved in hydrogenase expression